MKKLNLNWKIKRRAVKRKTIYGRNDAAKLTVSYEHTYQPKKLISQKYGNIEFCAPDSSGLLFQLAEAKLPIIKDLDAKLKISIKTKNNTLGNYNEEVLDNLILNTISIPIMLYSAIEAFVNQRIFEERRSERFESYHYSVQRYTPLKEKLFNIIPELRYQKDYFKKIVSQVLLIKLLK